MINPDGMSLDEVAAALGISRAHVHTIEMRALAKLRKRKGLADFEGFTMARAVSPLARAAENGTAPGVGERFASVVDCDDAPDLPCVPFAAEGNDAEWCGRMWRAYTRAGE